jgi:hypothetical protein
MIEPQSVNLLYHAVRIICDAMGYAVERKKKRKKDDPSRDSKHAPPAIRAIILNQLD